MSFSMIPHHRRKLLMAAFVHSLGHSFDPIHDFLLPPIVHHFIFNAAELQVAHRYHHRIGMAC